MKTPDTTDVQLPAHPLRVVLYVDDSSHWHAPARLLGEFLRATPGRVTILSVLLLPGSRAKALDEARRLVALPDERVKLVGRPGLLEYVLPDVAREEQADLVVVGRLGSADRLTSGLIAHLLVKRTPASVLIARGRPTGLRSVLVCTEGDHHGRVDFERACLLAKVFGAKVTVLHVLSQMALTQTSDEDLARQIAGFLGSDAPEARHLRELGTLMRERGIEGSVEVRSGLIVEEILDALQQGGHDLLIIGAHEDHSEGAALYEDLASLILRASNVSTLVVRQRRRTR